MNKEKWKSFLTWAPPVVALLYLLIAIFCEFNTTFVLLGGGASVGLSIASFIIVVTEPQDTEKEDVRELREIVQEIKAKTDVIYRNVEEIRQTVARIDVRTERINEIAIDIGNIKALQQSGHAREDADVLTTYINAALTEYVRLKTELDESENNVAYLSQENAKLSSRIRALEQQLKQQKTENNSEERKK